MVLCAALGSGRVSATICASSVPPSQATAAPSGEERRRRRQWPQQQAGVESRAVPSSSHGHHQLAIGRGTQQEILKSRDWYYCFFSSGVIEKQL